jgi:transposase-like protein
VPDQIFATRLVAIPEPADYERKLHTKAGEVRLKVLKLRRRTFATDPASAKARGAGSTFIESLIKRCEPRTA